MDTEPKWPTPDKKKVARLLGTFSSSLAALLRAVGATFAGFFKCDRTSPRALEMRAVSGFVTPPTSITNSQRFRLVHLAVNSNRTQLVSGSRSRSRSHIGISIGISISIGALAIAIQASDCATTERASHREARMQVLRLHFRFRFRLRQRR